MSVFENVSNAVLELSVDGVRYEAAAGGTVKIPDEFDAQLADQPAWKPSKKKSAPAETEPVAATEGDN